jgi:quercetin dioxygenase-like cupin family protein
MPATLTDEMTKKSFDAPDEVRPYDKGRAEVLSIGELTLSRSVFEPGWRWSTSLKPLVGGESCQVRHVGYMISGRLGTAMDDGSEMEFGPGDVVHIPPGHDGWTVGDEPAVLLQIIGAAEYAKK